MGATESRSMPSRLARDIDEWFADATVRPSTPDTATKILEREIHAIVHGQRPATAAEPKTSETCDDALAMGVTSVADIEKLIEELLIAGDYLQSEGDRVRHVNARYAHLAQTASASVKIITDSLGKWHNLDTVSQAPAELPRAPTLAPVHDGEQHEFNDQ